MAEKKKAAAAPAPAASADKRKALETAIAQIEKNYGKGAIMRLGDDIAVNVEAIPTGSLSLDLALGIGGVPRGRIVRYTAPRAAARPPSRWHIVASAQKGGGEAAYIDVEHALEPAYARALGVNIDELLISQPDTGEQALEITEQLVRSGALDVVVIDSVAALLPRSELEGEMGESSVGVVARLMSQALRKLAGVVSKTGCIVIFINQLREKIGVMYGNPETTPGGRALKYFASVRIDMRRIETLKKRQRDGGQPHPRQGDKEQGRTPLQGGGVRHPLRPGHKQDRRDNSTSPSSWALWTRPARGSPWASSASRAATTSRPTSRKTPRSATSWRRRSAPTRTS